MNSFVHLECIRYYIGMIKDTSFGYFSTALTSPSKASPSQKARCVTLKLFRIKSSYKTLVSGKRSLPHIHTPYTICILSSPKAQLTVLPTVPSQSRMCTTYRVYYYCGHLKSTSTHQHSDIECIVNEARSVVIDEKCKRCLQRTSQRNVRLGAIMNGAEVPSIIKGEEDGTHSGGNKR
jgi:hypothetical protein